jgi:hypothetical protein
MPNSAQVIPRCENGKTYGQKCRCDFCRKQVATMNAMYMHRKAQRDRGIQFDIDLIDPAPSRELLLAAQEHGITDRDLEKLTGLRRETFSRIRLQQPKQIRRSTAVAIRRALADIDGPVERHPMTLVDSKWVRQMAISLCAQGWSRQHQRDILKNNLGVDGGFIQSRSKDAAPVKTYYKNEQHMKWLVRAIGERMGPATATAKRLQNKGIFPTKHYNIYGDLIKTSLSKEQRAILESV